MKLTKYDSNLAIYNDQAVVRHYTEVRTLEPCEKYIFEKNVFFFDAILDIGVGGGRTTPFLSARACHYVGIDYSEAMIKGAGSDFPSLEFKWADATNLRQFENQSFDIVVFSFNGIDYIRTNEERTQCLSEIRRVLKHGDRFIFSSHHARAVGVWSRLFDASIRQTVWGVCRSIGF